MEKRRVYIGGFKEFPRNLLPQPGVFIAHDFSGRDREDDQRDAPRQVTDYRLAYDDGLRGAGFYPIYAPVHSGTILETLVKEMVNTDAGIFDISFGRKYNANVLIELGISIGLNHPTLVVAEEADRPVLDFLDDLDVFFYKNNDDLAMRIGDAVKLRINDFNPRLSPYYCVTCKREHCACRKQLTPLEKTYLLIGADDNTSLQRHMRAVAKEFDLRALELAPVVDHHSLICTWLYNVKRSKFVLLYSQELGKRHHGKENAATMIQLGLALGVNIPWRFVIAERETPPTDVVNYIDVRIAISAETTRSNLRGAIGALNDENNPYHGIYDILRPPDYVEEEILSIDESTVGSRERLRSFNVPEWQTTYVVPEPDFGTVREHLITSDKNVVITGSADAGKTILAAALCHDQSVQERYRDGIYWFNVRSLSTLDDLLDVYAEIFKGLSGEDINVSTQSEAMVKVADLMKDRAFLLILNGLDEIAPSVETGVLLVSFRWITTSDTNRLLITSRTNLLKEFEDQKDSFIIHVLGEKPNNLTRFAGQKIFLSYKRGDEFVGELVQILQEANLNVFSDKSIKPMDNWQQAIQDNIESAEVIIAIISEVSSESESINFDLTEARRLNKRIIPILVSGDQIPSDLQAIQIIDFRSDTERGLEQLDLALRQYLGSEQTVSATSESYLFVNHSRQDQQVANRVTDLIRANGFSVWADNQLFGGQDWWGEIERRISECAGMIYLLSPASIQSEYCIRELELAQQLGKQILPVLIADNVNFPESIRFINHIDMRQVDMPENHSRLLTGVSRLFDQFTPVDETDISALQLNSQRERDIAVSLVKAGWNSPPFSLRANEPIQSNVIPDFVLAHAENTFIAVVEVKGRNAEIDQSKERANRYRNDLNASFAYIVDGDDIIEIDAVARTEIVLQEFPDAQELLNRSQNTVWAKTQERQKKETYRTRIFINYARADTLDLARKLSSALKEQEYDVFFDMDTWDIDANVEIDMQSEVSKSDIVVSLQSPNTFASEWWIKELAWALEMGKLVVPVLVDGYTMPRPDNLPQQISQLAYLGAVAIRSQDFERDFERLVQSLNNVAQSSEPEESFFYISGGYKVVWQENDIVIQGTRNEPLMLLRGHTARVIGVLELPNERLLSWSEDRTLRIWSQNGEALAVLEGHTNTVTNAEILEDGRIKSTDSSSVELIWSSDGQLEQTSQQSAESDRTDVYISSTSRDLPDHRKAVQEAVLRMGMFPIMMEDFSGSSNDTLTVSLEMTGRSNIYVLLLGQRYGYVPDDPRNPGQLSVVELEYNEAVRLDKPILAFVMDDRHPVSFSSVESDESSRKLREFKEKVMQQHVAAFFTSPDDLRVKVIEALASPQQAKRSATPISSTRTTERTVKVFLSGPGDVDAEKEIARQTIDKLSKDLSVDISVQDPSDMGQSYSSPQDMVNRGLPKPSECDIVIAIFWSRIGTPLVVDGKEYLSGTHWELLDALSSTRPETLLYRRTEMPTFEPSDTSRIEQYRKVEEFFKSDFFYGEDGRVLRGVNTYHDPEDFRKRFEIHFEQIVERILRKLNDR